MIQINSNNQLWVRIKIKRNWASTRWDWSYQIGEDAEENFTGSANSRWGARKKGKRHVRKFFNRFVVIQIETSEFEKDLIKT